MINIHVLRRYDTIKLVDENSLNFPQLFNYREILWKSVLKTVGRHSIFWVLEVKRSKTLQKLNIRDYFCLHSWFHFFMTFLAQKLIYAINKQFWGRSSIKFNDRNVHLFQNRNPRWSPKSETLTVRKKSEKNMAVRSYFLKKT